MNRFLVLASVAVACAGCKVRYAEEQDVSERGVLFNVGMLTISREEMTSGIGVLPIDTSATPDPNRVACSSITLGQAGMTELWVFEGSTLLAHQKSSRSGFGSPSISLTHGEHSLTFVASNQSGQQFVDGVWSADKATDCYGSVHVVDVTGNTPAQRVVLSRCAYGLKWQSTDALPSEVKTLRLTVKDHSTSLVDGLSSVAHADKVWTYDVSGRAGSVISVTVYGLPNEHEIENDTETTIEWLSVQNSVLYDHSIVVPVCSNRMSIVSGALFRGTADAAIHLNDDWDAPYEATID